MVFARSRKPLGFVLLFLSLSFSGWAPAGDFTSSYALGSGDLIIIQVFDEPDMSIETRISDRGTVSYPFLGELSVSGMSALQLEDMVTRRLKGPYLVNPEVTVSILEYRPFFVNGEVEKPGGFPFSPGLTVRKAVSLAGGFKERANKSRINVVRDDDPDKSPKSIELGDHVLPGDIVTVERSFF
jgi:protein involved in polysaccharide export with SLBB domain